MIVKKVKETDIINGIENEVIVYNQETRTYFRKDKNVELDKDYTFKEAILGPYKEFARVNIQRYNDDGTAYFDDLDNEYELLNVFREKEKLREELENRIMSIKVEVFNLDVVNTIQNEEIDDEYLSKFSKVIYVSKNGNDENDGSEEAPVKTIRKAEELIEENSLILIDEGIYDITFNNPNSDVKYCQSGLASKLNRSVTYRALKDVKNTILVVDTRHLNYLSRDITFANELKNPNIKIENLTFKMIDETRVTPNSVSIARNCDGITFQNCIFEMNVKNANLIYNKVDNETPIRFNKCVFNIKKELNDDIYNRPYLGKYEINECYLNEGIKEKIENYDMKNKNRMNKPTLINSFNLNYF